MALDLRATAAMSAFLVLAPSLARTQTTVATGGRIALDGNVPPAQLEPGRVLSGTRPTVVAVRAKEKPALDGRLDDAVWRTAALIDTFVQEEPVEGAPATERTEVRVAYDSETALRRHLRALLRCQPGRANRVDRDRTDDDDTVTVFLDPVPRLPARLFVLGQRLRRAARFDADRGAERDGSDPRRQHVVQRAVTHRPGQLVEDGWTAEIAIPFKSLRYPGRKDGEAHRWGFQVGARSSTKNETVVWAPVSRDNPEFPAPDRRAHGMTESLDERNFELLPTVHRDRESAA